MQPNGDPANARSAINRQSKNRELRIFFATLATAEAIEDPIQRCIGYPDPPGSHWSHAAVSAYCRYRLGPVMGFDEIEGLIRQKNAAEVDRRLGDALKMQLSHSGTAEPLDRIYNKSFLDRSSPELRKIVDEWKRQSPHSAFAYTASGMLYVAAAAQARGGRYASETPKRNFVAMRKRLKLASVDLDKAAKLDPRVMPALSTMMRVGGLNGDRRYADDAAKRAFDIDPSSFSTYLLMSWLAQPKWGGSLDEMRQVTARAQQHADANPLLVLLLPEADAVQAGIDVCGCEKPLQLSDFKTVFDHAPTSTILIAAANDAANNINDDSVNPELAAIFLSEALRFNPSNRELRLKRVNFLAEMGQRLLARSEADRLVAAAPGDTEALNVRAFLEMQMHDYPGSERDYLESLRIKPNPSILAQLGHLYVDATHEWDKGWDISDRLIRVHPENADGWILRAHIQKNQPRDGLRETIGYFLAHFGNEPRWVDDVADMREWLSRQPHLQ